MIRVQRVTGKWGLACCAKDLHTDGDDTRGCGEVRGSSPSQHVVSHTFQENETEWELEEDTELELFVRKEKLEITVTRSKGGECGLRSSQDSSEVVGTPDLKLGYR